MKTIALGIPHCSWLAERVATLDRLLTQLGEKGDHFRLFTDREPNWSWSPKLWGWALETGADYLLQLQDDAIVCHTFWTDLHAMLDEHPDQIIGLETAHPLARFLYEQDYRWCTTADGLIGVGYVLPRAVLDEFMKWRASLPEGATKRITEDTLIGLFAYVTGRKIYHPIPTIIDHDVTVRSVYNNDAHPNRRPSVSKCLGDEPETVRERKWWIPHLGCFYGMTMATLAKSIDQPRDWPQPSDARQVISDMITDKKPIRVCCICGINWSSVTGLTGLGLCGICAGTTVKTLMDRR